MRQLEPAAGQAQAPGGHGYYRYIYISIIYISTSVSISIDSIPSGDAQLAPRHPPQLGLEPRDRGLARVGGQGEHYVAILSSYCHRVILSYCHNYRTHVARNSLQPEPLGGHEVAGLRDAPPQHPRGCNSL